MGRVILVLVLSALLGAGVFGWIRGEGTAPTISVVATGGPERRAAVESIDLGRTPRTIELLAQDEGSGVRRITARLRSADGERDLGATEAPGGLLRGGAKPRIPHALPIALDARALGLKEGDAFIVVEARDWSLRDWLKGNAATLEIPLRVDLRPPRVAISNGITYLKRSGSGAAYYSVTEDAVRDGVEVGERIYRGFPRKGGAPTDRVALFAIARDQGPEVGPRVFAEDRAGNRTAVGWSTDLKDAQFAEAPIELGPNFMDRKIPELADELGYDREDVLAAFQRINSEERAKNEARIREIVAASAGEKLFDGPFAQMLNSQVTSRFAEHRSYFYQGKQVSEAIHYGYDLASTAGAPIEAANRGRVLFAGPLGIYGNCVILDHGLGLTSLYGHLAQIDVQEEQLVEKGARIGRSGKTGLAGGDHLHFAILVGETYVDPVEWWDAKWVREKIDEVGGIAPEPSAETAPVARAADAAQ